MKTLVLNTLGKEVSEQIKALIKDKEVEIIETSGMKIAHCMGCNQCWLKTPGICAIKDDYEEIIKKLVETENLWIVSETRFGFLDYKGKRVMDRIVPMLNMTVGFRDGWMRNDVVYSKSNNMFYWYVNGVLDGTHGYSAVLTMQSKTSGVSV